MIRIASLSSLRARLALLAPTQPMKLTWVGRRRLETQRKNLVSNQPCTVKSYSDNGEGKMTLEVTPLNRSRFTPAAVTVRLTVTPPFIPMAGQKVTVLKPYIQDDVLKCDKIKRPGRPA
jgi:hypothetical protein